MVLVALLIAGAILAVTLLFQALGNNSNYFYSPTEVAQGKAPIDSLDVGCSTIQLNNK
jgi:cytochrome c-type biogenesis protein CcmE